MTTQLKTFTFVPGLDLRSVEIDGNPWFAAKDVCDVLGTHTKDVRANLDAVDICTSRIPGLQGRAPLFVSEAGLYGLILKSRKPEAKAFARWVTKDVLPSLRKHGMAMTVETAKVAIESPEVLMARALVVAQETIAKLTVRSAGLDEAAPEEVELGLWAKARGLVLDFPTACKLGRLSRAMSRLSGRDLLRSAKTFKRLHAADSLERAAASLGLI